MSAATSFAGGARWASTRTSSQSGATSAHSALTAWRGRPPSRTSQRPGGGPCRTSHSRRRRWKRTSGGNGSELQGVGGNGSELLHREQTGCGVLVLSTVQCPESSVQSTAQRNLLFHCVGLCWCSLSWCTFWVLSRCLLCFVNMIDSQKQM